MKRRADDLPVEVRVPVLMTVAAVAEVLGRSPKTVRRRIHEGAIPAVIENGQLMVRGDELRAYIDGLARPSGTTIRRRRHAPSPYARLAG